MLAYKAGNSEPMRCHTNNSIEYHMECIVVSALFHINSNYANNDIDIQYSDCIFGPIRSLWPKITAHRVTEGQEGEGGEQRQCRDGATQTWQRAVPCLPYALVCSNCVPIGVVGVAAQEVDMSYECSQMC